MVPKTVPLLSLVSPKTSGPLAADSEGLLLLSDEPALNARLLQPRHAHEREYWVQVERIPSTDLLKKLEKGVMIQSRKTLPCRAWMLEPQPSIPPRDPPIRFRRQEPPGPQNDRRHWPSNFAFDARAHWEFLAWRFAAWPMENFVLRRIRRSFGCKRSQEPNHAERKTMIAADVHVYAIQNATTEGKVVTIGVIVVCVIILIIFFFIKRR